MTRNITLNLPVELMRQAKVYAAQHDTTINSLVRDLLEEKIVRQSKALAAAKKLLSLAEGKPLSKVSPVSFNREDLHER